MLKNILSKFGYMPRSEHLKEVHAIKSDYDTKRKYLENLSWTIRDTLHYMGADMTDVYTIHYQASDKELSKSYADILSLIGSLIPELMERDLCKMENKQYSDSDLILIQKINTHKVLTPLLDLPATSWINLYRTILAYNDIEKAISLELKDITSTESYVVAKETKDWLS